jgi:hypothetical protein
MPRDESNIITANDVNVYVGNRRENNCQRIIKPQYIFDGFRLEVSDSNSKFQTRTRYSKFSNPLKEVLSGWLTDASDKSGIYQLMSSNHESFRAKI